jgi:ABC-2 type transport system permease protein
MRAYFEFAKKAFQNNLVYRVDYIIGVINTIISIFVYIAIWKAIYSSNSDFNGITFQMVATNFILGLAISNTFSLDDFIIANKVSSGSITVDLLKPIHFNLYILSQSIGNIVFKMVMHFLPALILSALFIGLLPPFSIKALIISVISIIFGFFILYIISYITSLLSFWFYNIWSISTIKNVVISILSGTLMPIWFMPKRLVDFIKMTPFDSIYFTPISIYLGRISTSEIYPSLAKQIVWIFILTVISQIMWKSAVRKLVLQGG